MEFRKVHFREVSASLFAAILFTALVGAVAFGDPQAAVPPVVVTTPVAVTAAPLPRLRYRVVVLKGEWGELKADKWTLPPIVADSLQEQLIQKLQDSGYFIVVEKDEQAAEQSDDDSTLADHSGADYIITPSAIGYAETKPTKKGVTIADVRLGGQFGQATVTLNVRISDSHTGDLLYTLSATGKARVKTLTDEAELDGQNFTEQQFQNTPPGEAVSQALDDAVSQCANRLSTEPWTALVAAQDDTTNRVIINAGDLAGVVVGELFDIYRASDPVLDPTTGATISQGDETIVGRIRVVRTERYAAYCDVVNGDKFEAKDIVKPAE